MLKVFVKVAQRETFQAVGVEKAILVVQSDRPKLISGWQPIGCKPERVVVLPIQWLAMVFNGVWWMLWH